MSKENNGGAYGVFPVVNLKREDALEKITRLVKG
ncbi:MAG: hypothetical protein KatS3mg071_1716 [Meiothermus sp.]|nr:MAG: hypothetical protein KatS3mg071_1716 [Meiothermus sp.]